MLVSKIFFFLTLQYCISFAKYWNESPTGIPVFPILNPPPSSLPIPSLWIFPVHQPQASSILHRTWTGHCSVWLFATPWTAVCQASLSFTISQGLTNSCPLSQWYYPTISSSATLISFCLQFFLASGAFPMSLTLI